MLDGYRSRPSAQRSIAADDCRSYAIWALLLRKRSCARSPDWAPIGFYAGPFGYEI